VSDERPRSEAEESPFTLLGHRYNAMVGLAVPAPTALPPKHNYPGSPANYWLLDESIIANMAIALNPTDPTVPVFKMPHAVIEGVVNKVISETDGDHHLWVQLDNSKMQLACEIAPQNPLPVPNAGDHVRVYGIWRYDFQHGWWEIHPVDFLEAI